MILFFMSCLCSSLKGSPRTISRYAPDKGDNWGGSAILLDWTAVVGGWTKTGSWFSHSAERGRAGGEASSGTPTYRTHSFFIMKNLIYLIFLNKQ